MSFDAVVVGGGPAGSSLALYLSARGWRVALVDDARQRSFKPGEGLVPAAKRLLRDLGLWERFQAQGHLPSYGNESAWGSAEVRGTDFIRSLDGHGWHLDRMAFDRMLLDHAAEAGVELVEGFVEQVSAAEGGGRLHLRDGRRLDARWVADATGRSARVARQMGARRLESDALLACYLAFEAGRPGDRHSLSQIEAAPEGWWYSALLPDGRRAVYCFTDAGLPGQRALLGRAGFLAKLGETTFVRLRLEEYAYAPVGEPQAVDARSARLDRFHGPGWLALGDAALSFDPLSSQGILTALYGGLKAGQALAAFEAGQMDALQTYARQLDNVWTSFAAKQRDYYRYEGRWPESPFWQRRLAMAGEG